jgi:phosphate transport system substrate-binding protein
MKQKSEGHSICLFGLLILIACGGQDKAIKMKGSDTEVNLAVNLAEQFSKNNSDFSIAISGGGSGLGITSLLNGQADIANSSRPLTDEEAGLFKEKDIELETVVFAEDATAFIVHKNFPLDEIDLRLLARVLDGSLNNWGSITGENAPINIYGRQSSSGTHSFIKKKLKIEFSPYAKEMTGNAQIIEGIKIDKSGIGYVGAGYISQKTAANQGIKVLKIKATPADTAVSPLDQVAIKKKRYFFQRPLYQFVLAKSWDKVRPFIEFEKGPAGKSLIEGSGYYIIE